MMVERFTSCAEKLNERVSEYNLYKRQKEEAENKSVECLQNLKDLDASIAIVQNIAGNLQNNIKDKIVSIVQKALDATFPGLYFDMEFVTRRDKTECDLICMDAQGNRQSILDGLGGGAKDIISFALRVAVWSLDKTAAKVILLDESFKFLSAEKKQAGADLLDVLSRDLGIQFIIVSHIPEVISVGKSIYRIEKDKSGISHIKN